jgi:site-specific DNA-methyltransferase (adenine-specific)
VAEPYYADEHVTLYLGDCRVVIEWLAADVLVTDPPYGINWEPATINVGHGEGIANDADAAARDEALRAWGDRPAAVFGALRLPPPNGTRQVCVYAKPPDSGTMGSFGGFRRDTEGVYLTGPWPRGYGGRSSIIHTSVPKIGHPNGLSTRYGHPHAKPVDVMETLIAACPPGVIADPFAGAGSTLVAARNVGRRAIGVELKERYCERAAQRLAQGVIDFGPVGGEVA